MPNIAITSYCNLHCPYCFANEMITTQEEKNITIEEFQNILNWLNKNKQNNYRIGLIGGEPTLHPQINQILNMTQQYCEKKNIPSIIFTNGICLENIFENIYNRLNILINVNTPSAMTKAQFNTLNQNLNQIAELGWLEEGKYHKVTLGCNLCQQINDYSFFWNIIDNYNNIPKVRVSVTAPISKKLLENKELYYFSLKEKFLEFIINAHDRHIIAGLDCNQIPQCFFSNEELELINNTIEPRDRICHPTIDITSDFKASACFGAYDLVDYNNFTDLDALNNYLWCKKTVPLILNNTQGKCATCKEHEFLNCQGGCLAFAKYNNKEE